MRNRKRLNLSTSSVYENMKDLPGEMTFDEIGRRLGITGRGACMLYRSALRKLRRKGKVRELAQLVAAKDCPEVYLRGKRGGK
jgi:hypothetical protein